MTGRTMRRVLARLAGGLAPIAVASSAWALNPLEYADNGANQFARGGAWLATASSPIAVHYNPAALATQASSMSVNARMAYQSLCFDRVDLDPNTGQPIEQNGSAPNTSYKNVCNQRDTFPMTIPSVSMVWRVSSKLGVGMAIVPPAAYAINNDAFPPTAPVTLTDPKTGEKSTVRGPAPYRFQTMDNQSTILFPTLSVGYEIKKNLRIGVGFISGIAVINVKTGSFTSIPSDATKDLADKSGASQVIAKDYFMPGAVLSMHWSATPKLDLALWGRYVDGVRATTGYLNAETLYYQKPAYNAVAPICTGNPNQCSTAIPNVYGDKDFDRFQYNYPPPEVRLGIRYHQPRDGGASIGSDLKPVRDPLHDDVFDIEVNGSYTWNSYANEIAVRFKEDSAGQGAFVAPVGHLPPIADIPTGFKDSVGVRLGGQYNVIQNKLGLMAGTWVETQSQNPRLLNISQAGPLRGGVGGGLVLRQDFIDFTFGYQYQWSAGLNNHGRGLLRAPVGADTGGGGFSTLDEPRDIRAVDRREFRTPYVVNGGRLTQHAHAFALGTVIRF